MDRVLYEFLGRSQGIARGPAYLNLWVIPITPLMTRWVFETPSRERAPFTAADFSAVAVGQCLGVSGAQAVEGGYVGSSKKAGREWSWFHWPTYEPPSDVPHCWCDPH